MRTDVHRPSVIVPTDYEFVALENIKIDSLSDCHAVMYYRDLIKNHMDRTGGTYSKHAHGGTCHVCGAHCVWTVLFYHAPSNSYIRTGLDCADKLDWAADNGMVDAFKKNVKSALERKAGKEKAKALLEEAGLIDAWVLYDSDADSVPNKWEENTIIDIVSSVIRYGKFTEKQEAFVRSLLKKISNREAEEIKRAAEYDAADNLPDFDERASIEGVVAAIRTDETFYGYVTKMMVISDAGWKVWGTLPSSLSDAKKGDRVSFVATVTKSDDDPKFGFFKRPSKGKIVEKVKEDCV